MTLGSVCLWRSLGTREVVRCAVIGHQSQLGSGHCWTCTASCKAHSLSVQMVPATLIPITCNSNHGLQQFKGTSMTISSPGSFGPGYMV